MDDFEFTGDFNFGVPNSGAGGAPPGASSTAPQSAVPPSSAHGHNTRNTNTAMDASAYGRTPPTFTPSSYEASHFGKRQRANSISSRLRSASDLLNTGAITSAQKGLIKVRH